MISKLYVENYTEERISDYFHKRRYNRLGCYDKEQKSRQRKLLYIVQRILDMRRFIFNLAIFYFASTVRSECYAGYKIEAEANWPIELPVVCCTTGIDADCTDSCPFKVRARNLESAANQNAAFLEKRHSDWMF